MAGSSPSANDSSDSTRHELEPQQEQPKRGFSFWIIFFAVCLSLFMSALEAVGRGPCRLRMFLTLTSFYYVDRNLDSPAHYRCRPSRRRFCVGRLFLLPRRNRPTPCQRWRSGGESIASFRLPHFQSVDACHIGLWTSSDYARCFGFLRPGECLAWLCTEYVMVDCCAK